MPLADYFSASDDQVAVAVLETPGGPSQVALDTVDLGDIDPVVAMAKLEAILAGCDYQEARRRPRSGELLSSPDAESAFVVSVSDTLRDLLASATPDDLARAAVPWAATAELQLYGVNADEAGSSLEILAGLARRARGTGLRLYCWWAL